ncbi:TPA: Fe-S cluster protein [Patescibacteria group bacterium]|uniref:SUF system FeS assembly protein, NifU family n=1 Tax=Candidatus Gottesmanbacteria bacterium GW2011_GWA1_43_11 TaxID=1618436 RepID=A0A0G1FBL0_9BACT|nr:MAG: SUF system FeS assembly protein, NifU family [Candidatus Gottesmanbacteria bacterium GW2011_GWA1_43_11]HCS78372.1 Fe-S cluster protein [Patescibacteria group bacterium]
MDDLCRENILDHFKHPRNFGKLNKKNIQASDNLVSCGDELTLELLIKNDRVSEVNFYGQGCAISVSAASMLTETIKAKKISDLQRLNKDDILKLLGISLTPTRLKCALLSLEILHKALQNYGIQSHG